MTNKTMKENRKSLLETYGFDRFSQSGEDGIIEAIFDIIGRKNSYCIEVGAWDGRHLSNTANLWLNGWQALLIEADAQRYDQLVRNTAGHDCKNVRAYVQDSGPNQLDRIVEGNGFPTDVDFLSIDIDGDDYHVLRSSQRTRPRVFACEFNPTIPPTLDLVPNGARTGCSALSLCKLATEKGYELVAMTETNGFFVEKSSFGRFYQYETQLEYLFPYGHLTYAFSDYDGSLFLSRPPTYRLAHPLQMTQEGRFPQVLPASITSQAWCALKEKVSRLWQRSNIDSS